MVGWEPVLFQVLWVFKILTHLQLHYDQTVSLLRGPTTPKNLSILDNFGIFLHLFNLCSCQQGRTRNCYSGSCWAIVWTNIAWIMAAYLCRISNLHWFKCPPTCPQDDFHACMNQKQNKFTMLHCFLQFNSAINISTPRCECEIWTYILWWRFYGVASPSLVSTSSGVH